MVKRYWPAQLSQAAKSLPLNLQWLAAPGRSTCAMGAAAALAVGTAVVGTASAAREPLNLQRTAVVSELPGATPADPVPEAPADGMGSTTAVDAPAEPAPEAPPASVPLDELRVTSPFGWRENPLLAGAPEFHNGIDFGAVTGTPVKAAAAGTVTYAEYHQYGGLRIVVDHGNGTETTYNHLSGIHVEVGQWVDFNTVIGAIGSTGNSTGPHLHFEVLINGEYHDPAVWLGI
ncbi:M23 family metallopeptidase [Arthrobacter sp. ATA002]|uniref:M23 family metallopeptidase n=1 Tax=Arthrobacter sp. ATA002 TaxID=2991715 RepID=UPI0022A7787D|nr:M23 family metallopeptidase [Arthrobacter sp. ATA002]WAP52282.1 M23 family metallopeptidase [Arthrobacter sp. ATA002]